MSQSRLPRIERGNLSMAKGSVRKKGKKSVSYTHLNVKGRISYITSHARQENLYATYRTADNEFWSNLARESQQEFKRSGTEGKCIEARELIIALPEIYTRYEPVSYTHLRRVDALA